MTAKERTARLNAAFDVLADDLSQNELAEMTIAMTGVRTIDEVRQQLKTIRALARLHRAEVVALRWDDIDFEDQLMTVRHGKGNKRRIAAIADITDATKEALLALWEAQAGAYDCIFPTMTTGRNPGFNADVPMSSQTIVRLLKLSSERAGIGHLLAHDLCRTHITLALARSAPLQDMQAQAGLANPSTTLLYTQPVDARSRHGRIAY